MTTATGPHDVLAAVCAARSALRRTGDPSGVRGSRAEWAAVAGELQGLVDEATAAQDAAIVRLAAIEGEWGEDGTVVEVHRALGHVAVDAPAILSGVLTLSSVHAERRVRQAVRIAADGPEGTSTHTGLGGLHAAMRAGRVDAYRAQVVSDELEECPAEVAATVVASVGDWFGIEDASRLRRRTRRLLARVSPDLLRQRAVRARCESGLRRWVDEPGVDTWLGTFPSEEACRAWAAVDALAQQYVTDGVCDRIERARAKALTDLVTGHASVEVQVVLTTPVVAAHPEATSAIGAGDLVEVSGAVPGEPVLVARGWLADAVHATAPAGRERVVPCDPVTGALTDPDGALATDAYRPGRRLTALVRARDGRCRFPGCHVAARFCDLDHVIPWPSGPTTAANLACLCRRHHRTKQRPGWRAVLHPDATMSWTDPTGRQRTTLPVDHHHHVTLPDTGTGPTPPPRAAPRLDVPDGPHSALDFALEHRLRHHDGDRRKHPGCRVDVHDLTGRGLHLEPWAAHHRRRSRARPSATDPPPF